MSRILLAVYAQGCRACNDFKKNKQEQLLKLVRQKNIPFAELEVSGVGAKEFGAYPGLKGHVSGYPSFFEYNTSTNEVVKEIKPMDPVKIVDEARSIPPSKPITVAGYVLNDGSNRRLNIVNR